MNFEEQLKQREELYEIQPLEGTELEWAWPEAVQQLFAFVHKRIDQIEPRVIKATAYGIDGEVLTGLALAYRRKEIRLQPADLGVVNVLLPAGDTSSVPFFLKWDRCLGSSATNHWKVFDRSSPSMGADLNQSAFDEILHLLLQ